MVFKARPDIIAKQIGSELMLYDSANSAIHVLNITAAKIFQLCDGSKTLKEIAKSLKDTFDDVEHVQAYEDVKKTLGCLEEKNLVAKK